MKPAKKIGVFVLSATGLLAAFVVFVFDPAQYDFYPVCQFHQITGLNCPGCGATRALHALMHGRVADAARLNVLVLLCLLWLGWMASRAGVGWLRERRMNVAISSEWMWTIFAVSLVFGILRNLPGFEWLSP